jgi:hypothetical protein
MNFVSYDLSTTDKLAPQVHILCAHEKGKKLVVQKLVLGISGPKAATARDQRLDR